MNSEIIIYIVLIVLAILLFFVGNYFSSLKSRVIISQLEEKNQNLFNQFEEHKKNAEKSLEKAEAKIKEAENLKEELAIQVASQLTEREFLEKKLSEQKQELEQLNQRFTKEFENLANRILEEKSTKFVEKNKEQMQFILSPFQEAMKQFKDKVERANETNIQQHASLKQQIESLSKLNDKIGKEAENLTKALKGDKKMQGDWGEFTLRNILENSNLIKNVQYFEQETFITSNDDKVRTDFRIELPDNKHIIIDSKISLNAFVEYYNADEQENKDIYLASHLSAIKNHINSLSGKNYPDIPKNTLDFTIMFLPIESAYITAVQNDLSLFDYAFSKNIILASPSTLIAMLKTINNIWRSEYQNKNVIEIAEQAGKLYDKFTSLLDDFKSIKQRFENVQISFDETHKKLTGKDNLIKKVEKLKELGAKTKKQISSTWLNNLETDNTNEE